MSISQSRDNLLETLRMLVEERKKEVKKIFNEFRTGLEQSEEGVSEELTKLYSETRERVGRDDKKMHKLEKAKVNVQTDLVDNEFNSILQTTLNNFDAQIAEIRKTSVEIPTNVKLEWNKEELKRSIQTVCRIVSTDSAIHPDERNIATASQNIEVEVQRLITMNEEAKEELKRTGEKHIGIVGNLESRIAEKDKEVSQRDEELRNAQDELGRFSEKSQAIMDRHGAGKSKYEESLLLTEKEIDKQKDVISNLQLEVKNHEITQMQSNAELIALQLELDNLRRENREFIAERETLFSQIDQIKKEKDRLMRALTTQSRNDSGKQSRSYSIGSGDQVQVQELTERIRELESECKEKEGIMYQISSVENQDLQRKCSLLEKELSQLKSGMSIGNVCKSNLETIREKEKMLNRALSEKRKLLQRIEELELDVTLKMSETEVLEDKIRGLEKERKILLNKISFKDTETGDLREDITKLKSELTKTRRILANNLNSKEEVADDDKSTVSPSQSLGPRFEKRTIVRFNSQSQSADPKYKCTTILFAKKQTLAYTLSQVDNPKEHIGSVVVCRSKKFPFDYVAGTLKTLILSQYSYEKLPIAGIELIDPLGESDGEYNSKRYFNSKANCAMFLSTDEVYILCDL